MTVEIQTVKSMQSETKTDAAEVRDRENRRNNIVIYRLHESDAQTAEDRKKQDIETCLDLIRNTLEVDCRVEDLKQVFRLGQRIGQIMTARPTSDQFLLNSDLMQPKIRSWNHCIN